MSAIERYHGVKGGRRVARVTEALEAGGATILKAPDPRVAPFEYRVRLPSGEAVDLVCYAFTANKYRQSGRPVDEHRFQVKYGGDFDRVHELYIDKRRAKVTLMFGVHADLDLFIAVDPMMHQVTWFSRSIEFKVSDLEQALDVGWHGWERERSAVRRRVDPRQDLRAEALLAVRSENFVRYVELERMATGMDPGERLLLIRQVKRELTVQSTTAGRSTTPGAGIAHLLEAQLGLSANEVLAVIAERRRLLTAVLGGVAERHLERVLRTERDITELKRLDADGAPDFAVRYRNRSKTVRVECKNVRGTWTSGKPWVDFQKTRAAKSDPCSRYYAASQFEVLAACTHPVTETWDFQFRETATLPTHRTCQGKLAVKVVVDGAEWTDSLPELLDTLTR